MLVVFFVASCRRSYLRPSICHLLASALVAYRVTIDTLTTNDKKLKQPSTVNMRVLSLDPRSLMPDSYPTFFIYFLPA